jgi:hypothetical protein
MTTEQMDWLDDQRNARDLNYAESHQIPGSPFMTMQRAILSILAGTFTPPLIALQALQVVDLTRTEYWLGIATLTITSFGASGATLLSTMVRGEVTLRNVPPTGGE